jgi:RNA polymerase sigma factor (sigma-70 family)
MSDDASQPAREDLTHPEDPAGSTDPASELVALEVPLRRFVASRGLDAHQIDDVVQETMVRMLEVAPRLEVEALASYAFAVARNLITSGVRSESTARRNLPRLLDRHEPSRPDVVATDAEARRALGAALAKLSPTVRDQLLSRDLDRRPLHEVAAESNVSSGVLASQLHRTRARLRVDYLLALRKVDLPTATCEKVLVAISAADHRRQASLRAGAHLDTCAVCSELSPPLLSRDPALAGWAPLPCWPSGGCTADSPG